MAIETNFVAQQQTDWAESKRCYSQIVQKLITAFVVDQWGENNRSVTVTAKCRLFVFE